MTYVGESFISSLAGSSIPFTILNLLTTCQLLHGRGQGNSVLKRDGDGKNGGALRFFDTGNGLQRLTHVIRQSFKLTIVSTIAWMVYARGTPPSMSMPSPKYDLI